MLTRFKYFICEVNKNGIEIKEEITYQKFKEMQEYTSQLKYYSLAKNYRDIAITNGLELQKLNNKIKKATRIEDINRISKKDIAIEVNRLLLNYLVSFRTFVDNVQRYSGHIKNGNDFVANILNKIYNDEEIYSFFYKLRNYATHHSMIIDSISCDINGVYLNCSKEHLLEYDSWKPENKKFIQKCPEQIDILQYVEKMNVLIMSIYLGFVNYFGLELQQIHDDILKVMKEYKILNPHIIECNEKNEKTLVGAHLYGIGLDILKQATEELSQMPNVKIDYIQNDEILNN